MNINNTIVSLKPGFYIFRHPKDSPCPLSISRGPGGSGMFEILASPRTQGSMLRDGSDCIVIRVFNGPAELLVTAFNVQAGMAPPSVRVDQIGLDPEPTEALPTAAAVSAAPKAFEINPKGVSIIGHVQGAGDAVVAEGSTLGRPDSQLRLEGFQIMWPDKPEGLGLTYGVSIEGIGATPMVGLGQFCGTRNMARRITEVTFSLSGPQSNQFELQGNAYFSGGFVAPVTAGIALGGPSGSEHLTGLSLQVVPASHPPKAKPSPWSESPQTKVFKAPSAEKSPPAAKKAQAIKPAPATAKSPAKPVPKAPAKNKGK